MSLVSRSLLSFGAVLLAVGGLQSQPARAQFNFNIPIGRGGPVVHIPFVGPAPAPATGCNNRCGSEGRHRGNGESSRSTTNDSSPEREPTAPTSHEQTTLLKNVFISPQLSRAGSVKDAVEPGKMATVKEEERDWVAKVKQIIEKITKKQDQAANSRQYVATAGDITEHAIEQSLETAFKSARLDTFERFASENWTTERLRVKVLDIVYADLDQLLKGTNRGNVPMQQLNELIQRAAEKTYARIFELSELLAANRESAQFVQRLYQTHGSLVDDQLREGAEPMIFEAANAAIAPFEVAMRQDPNAYALHYRAERIVYDCLSEYVERISSSDNGIAAAGEIKQKISATAADACAAWLERQFGAQPGALLPQKPMPLRVVWSATGPKDDPSMYTTQSGTH
jgi:hypothetical protein